MPKRYAKKPKSSLAQSADKYFLYRRAVQNTEHEVEFIDQAYAHVRGQSAKPASLREDFCSTANTCCHWVRHRPTNRAVGLDIDPEPIAWSERNNLAHLTKHQRARVDLRLQNVLSAHDDSALTGFDVIVAMNFSYWVFTERETLVRYFASVKRCLAPGGIFIIDHYGGSETYRIVRERKPQPALKAPAEQGGGPGYTYFWHQAELNPINHHITCHISFGFKDGSSLRNAFTYHWRLWSMPELRDVLRDAGFASTTVFWEGDDEKGGGNGEFTPTETAGICPAYISYIVAVP